MLKPPMKVIYSFLSQIVFSITLVFSSLLNLSVPCYTYFAPLYFALTSYRSNMERELQGLSAG